MARTTLAGTFGYAVNVGRNVGALYDDESEDSAKVDREDPADDGQKQRPRRDVRRGL
jgi:hypothetical protein